MKYRRIILGIIVVIVSACTIGKSDDMIPYSPLSILSPINHSKIIDQSKINLPHIVDYGVIYRKTYPLVLRFFYDDNNNKQLDKDEKRADGFRFILRYFDPVTFRGAQAEFATDQNGNTFHFYPGYGIYRIRVGTFTKFVEIYSFTFNGDRYQWDIPVPAQITGAQIGVLHIFIPLALEDDTCHSNWIARRMAYIFESDSRQNRPETVCNEILSQVAQERAEDMAIRGYEGHVDPDGIGPNYKVEQAGCHLPDSYDDNLDSNNIESIAGGMNSPEAAWAALLLSPNHRVHLLGEGGFANQDQYGFGYIRILGSRYQYYYVYITAECL